VRAVTVPGRNDVDLDAIGAAPDGRLFVRDGVGLAGLGVAARVPRAAVADTLASIEHDDGVGIPGCGPVALGALAFRPGGGGELVVPRVVWGRNADGTNWVTTIDGADATLPDSRPPTVRAGTYRVGPAGDPEQYRAAVLAARDAVRAGRLLKAVIARRVEVEADAPIDLAAVLARLRASFGSSYRYRMDDLVGASPELLVERRGRTVRSHPLAGTAPRTGDPATDARLAAGLIASTKDQVEHRVVIDVVNDTLLPWCSYLDWEAEPSIVTVANVQHLGTAVEGMLSLPAPSALDLVGALSPTPALGGHPRAEALALIEAHEGFDRGRYGGAVGWVDAAGNGTWAVTIRCAEIDGARARLYAGGGIVAGSDPDAELAETQAKLQAMLSAIVRP
jgi:isochorismate synthase